LIVDARECIDPRKQLAGLAFQLELEASNFASTGITDLLIPASMCVSMALMTASTSGSSILMLLSAL
jgi:hypothetical protein